MPERQIDVALVRELIAEQFPDWAGLPVSPVRNGGWDNRTFRLGERMSVRLPSGDAYVEAVEKEHRWLPVLAAQLPLPIPTPIGRGRASGLFSRPWSVYGWLDGQIATPERVTDSVRLASDLAGFLVALRGVDATDGPPPGSHNFFRGAPLVVYDDDTRRALAALEGRVDVSGATAVWDAALSSAWTHPPVWFHGDVSEGNLLVNDGALTAVIDFGTAGIGDPACDLVFALLRFDGESRRAFAQTIDLDVDTWARARGWAIWKALIVAAGIAGTNSPDTSSSFRTIERVIAEHRVAAG